MDTRFLESFVAVVEQGSLAEAARRLNLTSAAVAQRIRALENEIGVRLLFRSGRTVRPTQSGAAILVHARDFLGHVRDLKSIAAKDTPSGELRLGAVQSAKAGLLPNILSGMAKKVLSAGTFTDPSKLTALVDAVQGSVVLDKGWDVLSFAQQLRAMSSGAIAFTTIPVQSLSLPTPSDGDAVKVDPAQVQQFVRTAISTPTVQASGDDVTGGVKPVAATDAKPPTSDTKQPATSTAAGCVN